MIVKLSEIRFNQMCAPADPLITKPGEGFMGPEEVWDPAIREIEIELDTETGYVKATGSRGSVYISPMVIAYMKTEEGAAAITKEPKPKGKSKTIPEA